jgi:hypothetical protein
MIDRDVFFFHKRIAWRCREDDYPNCIIDHVYVATFKGVLEWRSWILALSGKGWRRLSGSPSANEAMPIKWFETIGLINLTSRYLLLHRYEKPPVRSTYARWCERERP